LQIGSFSLIVVACICAQTYGRYLPWFVLGFLYTYDLTWSVGLFGILVALLTYIGYKNTGKTYNYCVSIFIFKYLLHD